MSTRAVGRRRGVVLAVAVALAVPAGAFAESLTDAWQMAVAHDLTLAAAAADLAAAQADERSARGARWPSVDANGGYMRLGESPTLDVMTPSGMALQ
ncbi:MAG: TolC family protein, partial [Gammaproteobacteria bacterium]|nr:TolC family protein [Gammaproteobacteria bacterium]